MLPKIDPGILGSVKHEINNIWITETLERVKTHDPIIGELICHTGRKYNLDIMGKMLLVYRLIESQIEANEMEELLNG